MLVKDIMTCNAEVIDHDTSLTEAARKVKLLNIGALPVCEGIDIIGMITDRDITIHAIAEKKDPLTTPVSKVMRHDIFYCFFDDDICTAAAIMKDESIHRLLVLDHEGVPVGFVSLADFAVKSDDRHLTCEILERISEPACPHR